MPIDFNNTTLKMLYKRKGPTNIMANNIFLHMNSVLYRTVVALNTLTWKEKINEGVSKFQFGSIPEHSCDDHLIVLN